MTVLGKILVFVNLVFSLLAAWLIVMVFSTRTNWNAAHTSLLKSYNALGASAQADVEMARKETKDKEGEVQAALRQVRDLQTQVANEKAETDRTRQQLAAVREAQGNGQGNVQALTTELQRRKDEVEREQKQRADLEKRLSEADLQLTRLRDERVRFEIQKNETVARNAEFQKEVEALKRENAQLRSSF